MFGVILISAFTLLFFLGSVSIYFSIFLQVINLCLVICIIMMLLRLWAFFIVLGAFDHFVIVCRASECSCVRVVCVAC